MMTETRGTPYCGGGVSAREAGYMEKFDGRAVEIVERLKSVNERLAILTKRLVGSPPEGKGGAVRSDGPPTCTVSVLGEHLGGIEQLCEDVVGWVEQLERL